MDSLFSSVREVYPINGESYVVIQGKPGRTYYFGVTDSVKTGTHNVNFTAQIVSPKVLYIESTRGRAVPSDFVYLTPGTDTTVYVIPYGGYLFDSWTRVSGTVTIDDSSSVRIKVSPQSDFSHIRANYVWDSTAVPELKITNLDLSNHPSICAQVSVVDKNTGRPIVGLDSSDYLLFQDTTTQSTQTTTIQSIGGVSVALVVDESGSMGGNRMTTAQNAIRQFINEMGPYDRTAIVGFSGGSSARVLQSMTSDKTLLLKAVDNLRASGNTNINTGAKLGVQQVVGETNPTTVIVFSDGANNDDVTTSNEVINLATGLSTNIYTIALETSSFDVLKTLLPGPGDNCEEHEQKRQREHDEFRRENPAEVVSEQGHAEIVEERKPLGLETVGLGSALEPAIFEFALVAGAGFMVVVHVLGDGHENAFVALHSVASLDLGACENRDGDRKDYGHDAHGLFGEDSLDPFPEILA